MTHFITLPAILILMQVLWYLPFFPSSLGCLKSKSFIRTSVHFVLKVQTFLALITTKNPKQTKNYQKTPTLTRAKEVLKPKKKWKKYHFPAKPFLNRRTWKHLYNSQNIEKKLNKPFKQLLLSLHCHRVEEYIVLNILSFLNKWWISPVHTLR